MRPSARLAAVVEILDAMDEKAGPAEHASRSYFRSRRYAGSKDRRWVNEALFSLFRNRGMLDWALQQSGLEPSNRLRSFADQLWKSEGDLKTAREEFLSGPHSLEALDEKEETAFEEFQNLDVKAAPALARSNFPKWMFDHLQKTYGDKTEDILSGYKDRAPLTLRVNSLRADREEVLRLLAEDGIEAEKTEISPLGLTMPENISLDRYAVYERGLVEIQDEAAQISTLLANVQPGSSVVDYCAGAGGKSLALAAIMENTGQIIACDISLQRMKDIKNRCRRAGVHSVDAFELTPELEEDLQNRHHRAIDCVFVDAPCSGSGTWRRQPDRKWCFSEQDLQDMCDLQQQIVEKASHLVREGGKLVYATCSIFEEENHQQVSRFLEKHPDFRQLPVQDLADQAGLSLPIQGDYMQLLPKPRGADGFFTAVLERC
ncbi:MAG: RsmB/NOP family class I SAM-dependent RNA methyltransferase [Sneathiellales bacterium]|nr:RsmB/NOP family class I SAM-dependent RNA methyltransferase [Sneathiellales bacterium]